MKLKEKTVSFMINGVNLKINIDDYILNALKEDMRKSSLNLFMIHMHNR